MADLLYNTCIQEKMKFQNNPALADICLRKMQQTVSLSQESQFNEINLSAMYRFVTDIAVTSQNSAPNCIKLMQTLSDKRGNTSNSYSFLDESYTQIEARYPRVSQITDLLEQARQKMRANMQAYNIPAKTKPHTDNVVTPKYGTPACFRDRLGLSEMTTKYGVPPRREEKPEYTTKYGVPPRREEKPTYTTKYGVPCKVIKDNSKSK